MTSLHRLIGLWLGTIATVGLAAGMQVPEPTHGLMATPAKGKVLFEKNCSRCHGVDLKGSDEGPPLLHRIYEPSHHSNASFQMAARYGARAHHWQFGDMPPVPGVSADDVAHITAYVRMVQRRAGIE